MSASDEPAREPVADPESGLYTTERAKAFIDAVVAIAMTLLILPLMEAVADGTSEHFDSVGWFGVHLQQLISFALSFTIIAMFWINHHRLYAHVSYLSLPLIWINVAWLLTIVWLPVATALIGRADNGEPVAATAYLGSLMLTSALMLVMRLQFRRRRELHDSTENNLRLGIAVDLAMITAFGASLAVVLLAPRLGYVAIFLTFLIGPLQSVYARLLGAKRPRRARQDRTR